MSNYFKTSSKSKILWVNKYGHPNGIRIWSYTSDYDYPGERVHYIEQCVMTNDKRVFIKSGLYPSIHLRPTYKQIKKIFNLIDSREIVEYLEEKESVNNKNRYDKKVANALANEEIDLNNIKMRN